MWNLLCLIAVSLVVTSYQWAPVRNSANNSTVLAKSYNAGGNSDAIRPLAFINDYGKNWQNIGNSTVAQPTTPPTDQNDTCSPCTCGALGKKLGIVGGNTTFVNEYPWMAMLLYEYDGKFFCGGSLINDRYVMTAAHCVKGEKKEDIIVRLLEYDWSNTTEEKSEDYKVLEMIIHEEYVPGWEINDIALLRLDTKVLIGPESKIYPVCLPEKGNSYDGYEGVVIGWGTTNEYFGLYSKVLLQVDVPIISNDACKKKNINYRTIKDTMMCAGYDKGGMDSCEGDSGGPLLIIENEYYHVAGIVSWGVGCGRPKRPGVYTRVNKYLDWLAVKTKDACSCNNVNNMSEINIYME